MKSLMKCKKVLFSMLPLFVFAWIVCANPMIAQAGEDVTAPVVTAVRVVNPEVTKPGVVNFELDVVEEDTGIKYLWIIFASMDDFNGNGFTQSERYYLDIMEDNMCEFTGKLNVSMPVSNIKQNGEWRIFELRITDNAGNTNDYSYVLENVKDENGNDIYDENGYPVNRFTDVCRTWGNNNGKFEFENPTFTVKSEFDIDMQVSLSNPNLVTRLQEMEEGKTAEILVDNNSKGIVKKEIFDVIKGKNKRIILIMDGIQWIFYGKDIKNTTKDIDILTQVSSVSGVEYGNDENIVKVDFASNGVLPGEAQIRLKSDYLYDKYGISGTMYLYYCGDENEDGNQDGDENQDGNSDLQEEQSDIKLLFDGTDKWCYFTINHNSTYLISDKKLEKKNYILKLSKVKYTYDGKTKNPALTVRCNGEKLKSGQDYTLKKPSGRKNVGTYKYTVTLKGKYKGRKTITFDIVPPATKFIKLQSKGKKQLTLNWQKKTKQVTGYEIRVSTSKKMIKAKSYAVSKNKTTSKTIKNLKSKKKYYVQIRTYKKVEKKKFYSGWSKVKSIKVK